MRIVGTGRADCSGYDNHRNVLQMNAGRLAELLGLFARANPDVKLQNVTIVEFAGWCREEGYTIPRAANARKCGGSHMVNVDSEKNRCE